jgi:hypothetical protein
VFVEFDDTVNNVNILSVAQQCFSGKFISPATKKHFVLHVKSPIFCQTVTHCGTPAQILEIPDIELQKNLSSGRHAVICRQADGRTMVTCTLHNYASALLKTGHYLYK